MGTCNPKPQTVQPPQKQTLMFSCKRLKYHLQIKQNKINQQIINGQSLLLKKINQDAMRRSKVQELLLAQRIVNGLKYSAAYTLLLQYAASIENSANFICENINDNDKLQPWTHKIYSLLYAAQKISLNTLNDFKNTMRYVHNEIYLQLYANKEIKDYLKPHPTPEQFNIYFIEMSQRNNISLQKINLAGHNFSSDFGLNSFDYQFQKKSKQFRDSLPKQQILGHDFNNNNGKPSYNPKGSIANPFDHNKPINPKTNVTDPNNQNTDEKVDNNDISPNITDMMKKIGSSKTSE